MAEIRGGSFIPFTQGRVDTHTHRTQYLIGQLVTLPGEVRGQPAGISHGNYSLMGWTTGGVRRRGHLTTSGVHLSLCG